MTVGRDRVARLARRRRRASALVRVLLGLVGLAILLPALVVAASLGSGGPLDPLAGTAAEVGGTVRASRDALVQVRAGLVSAETSLRRAESGARDGAELATDVGTTMDAMAGAASVEVLGIAPFAALVPDLQRTADQSRRLASSLDATADALAAEQSDLATVATSTGRLLDSLDAVRGSSEAPGDRLLPARLALVAVFGWLAVLATWWLLSGIVALDWLRRTAPAAARTGTGPPPADRPGPPVGPGPD